MALAREHSFAPPSDPALLSKTTEILAGLGRVHQKVPTESPEAQGFYDQGLAQLHSYAWVDAARSFHQALRIDPGLALAHLGLLRAYEGMKDGPAADRELATARRLVGQEQERERLYVAAFERKRQALAAEKPQRDTALENYRAALDRLTALDPTDAEAWLLRGNAEEGAWGRGQAGRASSLPFYQAALKANPDHPGAHHYLAHTYENLGQAEKALYHARFYSRLSPRAPHARHMYAHTLPRFGRWPEAIAELEAARELEEAAHHAGELPKEHNWHHVHNLNLLALAYLRTGDKARAETLLLRAFQTPMPDPLTQSWHALWPEFLLAQGRADEAARAAAELSERSSPVAQAIGLALHGEARLDLGDPLGAAERATAARRRLARLEAEAQGHPRRDTLVAVATSYADILDARRALHGETPAEWLDYVSRLTAKMAANPTFDGWGVTWLQLQRFARDADNNGHEALAARLRKQLQEKATPPDA